MKKGFTLIEVIGILVVLTIVFSITFPVVTSVLNNSKEKLYKDQIELIESAARSYAIEHGIEDTAGYFVTLTALRDGDYLESDDLYDPRSNTLLEGCVLIEFDSASFSYKVTYQNVSCGAGGSRA